MDLGYDGAKSGTRQGPPALTRGRRGGEGLPPLALPAPRGAHAPPLEIPPWIFFAQRCQGERAQFCKICANETKSVVSSSHRCEGGAVWGSGPFSIGRATKAVRIPARGVGEDGGIWFDLAKGFGREDRAQGRRFQTRLKSAIWGSEKPVTSKSPRNWSRLSRLMASVGCHGKAPDAIFPSVAIYPSIRQREAKSGQSTANPVWADRASPSDTTCEVQSVPVPSLSKNTALTRSVTPTCPRVSV